MSWVKVAGDNLPAEGSIVLCYWPAPLGRSEGEVATALFEDYVFRNPENEDDVYAEPTHWQPLPSPPTVTGEP